MPEEVAAMEVEVKAWEQDKMHPDPYCSPKSGKQQSTQCHWTLANSSLRYHIVKTVAVDSWRGEVKGRRRTGPHTQSEWELIPATRAEHREHPVSIFIKLAIMHPTLMDFIDKPYAVRFKAYKSQQFFNRHL